MSGGTDKTTVISLLLIAVAFSFLAYLGGIFAGIFQAYPAPQLQALVAEMQAELNRDANEGDVHFLYRERTTDQGLIKQNIAAMQPGVTLVTSFWRDNDTWQPAIRLLDENATVLHEWKVYPNKWWPQSPYDDWAAGSGAKFPVANSTPN